jgi:hypothetical protein
VIQSGKSSSVAINAMNQQPNNNFPKVPPFIPDLPPQKTKTINNGDGILRLTMLLVSAIILGVALVSGGIMAANILVLNGSRDFLVYKLITIGLAYLIGWAIGLAGIRIYNNLVLPLVINVYAWLTLAGISVLYIVIIIKLFQQQYQLINFLKYVTVLGVGFVALIGLHLLLEKHNFRVFAIPLLIIGMCHLFLIVFHYVFGSDVNYNCLWGDLAILIGMGTISGLMLAHVGVLNFLRCWVDSWFQNNESAAPTEHQ